MIRSKSYRDEENEKAGETLTGLLSKDFAPDLWRKQQRDQVDKALQEILENGLPGLYQTNPDVLLLKLQKKNFDAAQYESFGDLMMKLTLVETDHKQILAKNALFFYEQSQKESKTYFFSLNDKINDAKSLS